jgi:hypothetical protein
VDKIKKNNKRDYPLIKLFRFFWIIVFLLPLPSTAGVFELLEEAEKSHQIAKAEMKDVLPGKVLAFRENGDYLDFASAVVLTPKGQKTTTHSILSCAHLFNESIASDPNCRFVFYDSQGVSHAIEKVVPRSEKKDLNAKRDLAIFQLKDPIACNPFNEIAESAPKESLSCIAYGWVFITNNGFTINNACDPKTSEPYYYTNTFENDDKTFKCSLKTGQLVRIHDQYGYNRYYYLAKPPFSAQTALHDSGSSWFVNNNSGGYSFCALTSLSRRVRKIHRNDLIDERLMTKTQTMWMYNSVSFSVYSLPEESDFDYELTNLIPHRDWIYENCK